MIDGIKEDAKNAEAVLEIVENITAHLDWRENETELLKLARLRLLVALHDAQPEASKRPARGAS